MSDSQPLDLSLGPRRVPVSHSRVEQRLVAPSNSETPPIRPSPPRDINIASSSSSVPPLNDPDWAEAYRAQQRESQRARRAIESSVRRDERNAANSQLQHDRREREAEALRAGGPDAEQVSLARANRQAAWRAGAQRRAQQIIIDIENSAFNYDPTYDYASHSTVTIGGMVKVCRYETCKALRFKDEPQGQCCKGGKVQVDLIRPPPEPYFSYFSGDFEQSRRFLQNIRNYNNSFQMTSFGVKGQVLNHWSTFRIQGQVYHLIGSLDPQDSERPKFMQIYFMGDSEAEASRRCSVLQDAGLDRALILSFQEMLHANNGLIRAFKTARELLLPESDLQIAIRADRTPAGEHARRFNAPLVDEVAAILVQGELNRRDIVIRRRNDQLAHIDESHPKYDALQYPLLFPYGDDSWHMNRRQVISGTNPPIESNSRLSPRAYYAYQFMVRSGAPNFILQCRSLLNQYSVDMYAKMEAQRLLYLRMNQSTLRIESYQGLSDAISNDVDLSNVGRVILPSSFTGSPRHMQEYKQDAFTYVRQHGRADYFITVTCNSQWPEIQTNLEIGQTANDRHDIVARVFRLKLIKLKNALTKSNMFGKVKCWMYTIEWQKRGLPHAHMLFWLETRIRPEQIDQVISAELPDPAQDPVLFETIKKFMIHGPCGTTVRQQPCMENGKCTKQFPKPFMAETLSDRNGYPLYRRRSPEQGGYSFTFRDSIVDNRWVVPYNPTLCKMFNAHINVEACHSVQSIKYICKYITKGSDLAVFGVESNGRDDEITQYQLGRYLNSNEAFWRIFEFAIHERFPPVEKLAVHLPDQQQVVFNPERASTSRAPRTTLTAFFEICLTDDFAKTLLYQDIPRFYTFDKTSKKWCRRKRGKTVPEYPGMFESETLGRVFSVSPRHRELYHLRLLIITVPGPTSFEDLRTFEGSLCSTFHEACIKRGLLESDSHWEDTMQEGATRHMPRQLRSLFAVILTHGDPSDALGLWNKFKDDLSEDFLFRRRRENPEDELNFDDEIYNEALISIEDDCLAISGTYLESYGLPAPNRTARNTAVIRETSYDAEEQGQYVSDNQPKLTHDQQIAFDAISQAISNDSGGFFFLDAPGGTGKTFITNLLLAEVRSRREIILATASTGIAATLLKGGRTAHSTFGIPLDVHRYEGNSTWIGKRSEKAELLRQCKCIIWDECTMAHKNSLWGLDLTLRDLRGKPNLIFGGVVVVISGDFRQTLPVLKDSTAADALSACLKQSYLWPQVKKFSLTTNMRVHLRNEAGAEEFAQKLLKIGEGRCPVGADGLMPFTPDFCNTVASTDELINTVFPNIVANLGDRSWQSERAILAPLNDSVDEINKLIQDKLTGRLSRFYRSVDKTCDEREAINFPVEFLNSLSPSGFPPHMLELKVGSTIMVLRNLEPPKICNGTRLRVKSLDNNLITGTILAGEYVGEEVFIPRVKLNTKDDAVNFQRFQFPVKLAFAMTINKSQGQSLGVVGIDLSVPCFSHGQLYVACSRVGSPASMFVHAPNNRSRNVVYPQALT